MVVVVGRHEGQAGGWSHGGICRSTFRVRGDTQVTFDHTAIQVRSSGKGRTELVSLPGKVLTRGATSPCNRLAAFHGAPRMMSCRQYRRRDLINDNTMVM